MESEKEKLIYLAGIVDGEGHIRVTRSKGGSGYYYMRPEIIVINQYAELSLNNRKKLREFMTDRNYPLVLIPADQVDPTTSERVAPLLNIGQMIELLNEHRRDLDFYLIMNDTGSSVHIGLHGDPNPSPNFERLHTGIDLELCDALWEACKRVLEHEKA